MLSNLDSLVEIRMQKHTASTDLLRASFFLSFFWCFFFPSGSISMSISLSLCLSLYLFWTKPNKRIETKVLSTDAYSRTPLVSKGFESSDVGGFPLGADHCPTFLNCQRPSSSTEEATETTQKKNRKKGKMNNIKMDIFIYAAKSDDKGKWSTLPNWRSHSMLKCPCKYFQQNGQRIFTAVSLFLF